MKTLTVAAPTGPLGDAFINHIRILIVPIIFCTTVTGIAPYDGQGAGRTDAIKALIYFEIMTRLALIDDLLAVNILQPGAGMKLTRASAVPRRSNLGSR